jgi:NADH-quinone oxidoreductase subunit N
MTASDYLCLTPLLIIACAPIIIMLTLSVVRNYNVIFGFSLIALIAAFVSVIIMNHLTPRPLGVLFLFDGYGNFFLGLIIVASLLITILSHSYNYLQSDKEEYFIILFIATLGASILVVANHFISFFIGIETLSVSLFILIAYRRSRDYSIEASVKYLVLASVSSAFLLFGMALIYAAAGTMSFNGIGLILVAAKTFPLIITVGFGMMIVGVGFKLALVPFHMWTPDVYHGAPAPVTAFIASVSKAAVMAVLLRFFFAIKGFQNIPIFTVISVIAILTMFVGNFLAIREKNIKRILAYSSIANLGYLLITLLTGSNEGVNSAIFYIISYVITTLGAFGIISLLSQSSHDTDRLESYKGLFWRQPWLAAVFTITLLSLAGIPLTSGFMAKFYIVFAGLKSNLVALVISLIINSVIGLYYYLRIINTLFATGDNEKLPRVSFSGHLVLGVIALVILWLGLFPGSLVDAIAQYSVLR